MISTWKKITKWIAQTFSLSNTRWLFFYCNYCKWIIRKHQKLWPCKKYQLTLSTWRWNFVTFPRKWRNVSEVTQNVFKIPTTILDAAAAYQAVQAMQSIFHELPVLTTNFSPDFPKSHQKCFPIFSHSLRSRLKKFLKISFCSLLNLAEANKLKPHFESSTSGDCFTRLIDFGFHFFPSETF